MSKTYIKNFYNRDRLALTSLSKCGHCSRSNLNTYIADKRIKNYVRDNLITKEVFNKNNGEQIVAYKLTTQGREFLEKEWNVKNHYIAQSVVHDLGIANKYFSLTDSEKESWKTETEIRQEFREKLEELRESNISRYREINTLLEHKQISVPDCSYSTEKGVEVYFEVMTNSYGEQEIESKERFVEFMNIKSYEIERV